MTAVVWHGVGDLRLDDVPDPTIQDPTDAIVEITATKKQVPAAAPFGFALSHCA